MLRNVATRPQSSRRDPPNPREFTIAPNVKREDLQKVLFEKKEGDNIINERLLYLLLPRIKGQPPFTSTTVPTTITLTTKQASTTSHLPPMTTTTSNATISTAFDDATTNATMFTSTAPVEQSDSTFDTYASTTPKRKHEYPKKAKWSEEDTKEFELDSSELAILEREYTKKLAQLKAQKTERMNRHPADDNRDPTDDETTLSPSTSVDLPELPAKRNQTEPSTTRTPLFTTTNNQQFTVVFHTAAKQRHEAVEKSKVESKLLSILSNAVKEHDLRFEKALKGLESADANTSTFASHVSDPRPPTPADEYTSADTSPSSVEQVAEVALRNALKETEHDDGVTAVEPHEHSVSSSTWKPVTATGIQSTSETGSNADEATTLAAVSLPMTEEAMEVNEVLSLIEADEKAEKAEAGSDSYEIRRLREKTRAKILAFLERRVEKITAALDRTSVKPIISSTTVPPTTTSKSSTKSDSKISKNTIATEVTTTLTTSSTASASTTGTTDDDEPSVAFKQIPEAEEDDSDGMPEEGKSEAMNSAAKTTPPTIVRSSISPAQLNPEPTKLANVISPIAGIIDNIGPIIAPLLQSRAATASAAAVKAAGVRTSYGQSGRDLLVHSDGENSIIGYGTQLAREILNPGSLQRDREDRQRAIASKIASMKESMQYQSSSGNEVHNIPLYQALNPSLTHPVTLQARQSYGQAYHRVASIPLAEQAAQAAQPYISRPSLPPYFVAPPPGYVGPLPPPPPPPPTLPIAHNLLDAPRRAPVSPSVTHEAAPPSFGSVAPYTLAAEVKEFPSGFSIQEHITKAPKPLLSTTGTAQVSDGTGFERGRSEVKTTFFQDSGLMVGNEAPAPVRPPLGLGTSGAGFGGGRRPTESFDDVTTSNDSVSFYSSNRRRKMAKN